jgi:septal ring factor EnvC (AmiA/AmiB activator)
MSEEVILALISAGFSGVVLKLMDRIFEKRAQREQKNIEEKRLDFEEASEIRLELRDEIKELRTRQDNLQNELDEWKEKYYQLERRYNLIIAQMKVLGIEPTSLEDEGPDDKTHK